MESDTITFEEVKAITSEEIDSAKNLNDLLDRIAQRIYQKGKEEAFKDGARFVVTCEECKWHVDCGYHYCNKWCAVCPDNAEFYCAYGEHHNCNADMRGQMICD